MRDAPVIPVIVLHDVKDAVPLARALVAGGIRMLEVTLRTREALECIEIIAKEVPEAVAGAGTIRSAADAQASALAGARFGVSPGYTRAVGKACHDLGLPLLPGVATGSEIMLAQEDGFTELKFFPAVQAGGLAMLKAWQGPFGDVKFCPTGGVTRGQRARVPGAVQRGLRGRLVDRADGCDRGRRLGPHRGAGARGQPAGAMSEVFDAGELKVIAFDVFGTVVDWYGGIAAEAERIVPGIDGGAFALAWRAGYQPAMKSVMERLAAGEGGFTLLDELHMGILEGVLREFGVERSRRCAQARAQQGLAPSARLARCGRGPHAAEAQVHHLLALQRQHRPADRDGQERRPALGLRALGRGLQGLQARSAHLPRRGRGVRRHAGPGHAGGRPPRRPGGRTRLRPAHRRTSSARSSSGRRGPRMSRRSPDNTLHARDIAALADLLGC